MTLRCRRLYPGLLRNVHYCSEGTVRALDDGGDAFARGSRGLIGALPEFRRFQQSLQNKTVMDSCHQKIKWRHCPAASPTQTMATSPPTMHSLSPNRSTKNHPRHRHHLLFRRQSTCAKLTSSALRDCAARPTPRTWLVDHASASCFVGRGRRGALGVNLATRRASFPPASPAAAAPRVQLCKRQRAGLED